MAKVESHQKTVCQSGCILFFSSSKPLENFFFGRYLSDTFHYPIDYHGRGGKNAKFGNLLEISDF